MAVFKLLRKRELRAEGERLEEFRHVRAVDRDNGAAVLVEMLEIKKAEKAGLIPFKLPEPLALRAPKGHGRK